MKILHINSYYSTTSLYTQMYRHQRDRQLDFDVYVPISYEYPTQKLKVEPHPDVIVSRCYKKNDRLIFYIKHRKILKDMVNKLTIENYDILHAHSLFSNGWLAFQLHQSFNIPYIVAVRATDVHTFFEKMPFMRRTGIDILKHAEKVIFISDNTRNIVAEKYIPKNFAVDFKNKSLVIPNGINEYWHENRFEDKDFTFHQPVRIVATGRLHPHKRFITLAEMTQLYHQNYQPLELHVVGKALSTKIEKTLSQFDHIIYHGELTKESILNLYREMDIFALLSSPETFGLVYAEAMTQGLPIICTRGEGFDSYLENHEFGVSVDKNDYIGFNQAVDYICTNYEQLAKQAIVESNQFNWLPIIQEYEAIYEQIMRGTE